MIHKHHIIPKHMGGSDDPSNIQKLTIKEHAEAHKKLYEEHGKWQDLIAYKMLSGQISSYKASQEARRLAQLGRKFSKQLKKKLSEMKIGNKNALGNKGRLGKPHSEETKRKMRLKKLGKNNPMYGMTGKLNPFGGKKHTEETKRRISESKKRYNKVD